MSTREALSLLWQGAVGLLLQMPPADLLAFLVLLTVCAGAVVLLVRFLLARFRK